MLQSMGSQRVGHDLVNEQQQQHILTNSSGIKTPTFYIFNIKLLNTVNL